MEVYITIFNKNLEHRLLIKCVRLFKVKSLSAEKHPKHEKNIIVTVVICIVSNFWSSKASMTHIILKSFDITILITFRILI